MTSLAVAPDADAVMTSRWSGSLRVAVSLGTAAVVVTSAIQSWRAIADTVEAWGIAAPGWGGLYAATLDGFMVTATAAAAQMRRSGHGGTGGYRYALSLMVATSLVSVALNAVHAPADAPARLAAALPSLWLIAAVELWLRLHRPPVPATASHSAADVALSPATDTTADDVPSAERDDDEHQAAELREQRRLARARQRLAARHRAALAATSVPEGEPA